MTKEDFKRFVEAFAEVCGLNRMTSEECEYRCCLYSERDGVYVFHLRQGKIAVEHLGYCINTHEVEIDEIKVGQSVMEGIMSIPWIELKKHGEIIFSVFPVDDSQIKRRCCMRIKAIGKRYNAENEGEAGGEA